MSALSGSRCPLGGPLPPETEETLRRFSEFCASIGPPRPLRHTDQTAEEHAAAVDAWSSSLTPEQRQFRRQVISDPEWRAFVGLPPLPQPSGDDR